MEEARRKFMPLARILAAQCQGTARVRHQAWGWDWTKDGLGCDPASRSQVQAW